MKKPGTHLQSANSPVINVAGSVGGIFTGNGASATINQRVEARQDALIDALETLAKAIASEKSLEVALQTSLAHDARSAAAEVASPQPRYGRIASLLGGIAASVGTLGAIKPAIEAVLDMATAAGIELP